MISRVAEHCFWLSRYLERAENTARVLEVNYTLLLDLQVPAEQQWRPLLIISGIHDYEPEPTAEGVQEYMTWDESNPFSITSSFAAARENARIIREVISAEMWERINYYHLWLHSPAARQAYDANRTDFFAQIRRINQLIHGIAASTMSHGEAWEFFRLGAYLERASQTARILDVKYHTLLPDPEDVGTPVDNAHWVAILMSCSGYEPFHKRPRPVGALDPGVAVADFLIFDAQFPRSVLRCLWECRWASSAIQGEPFPKGPANEADRALDALIGWLNDRDIDKVVLDGLHETLTEVVDRVHGIGDTVNRTYFQFNAARPPAGRDGGPPPSRPAITPMAPLPPPTPGPGQTAGGQSQTQSQSSS